MAQRKLLIAHFFVGFSLLQTGWQLLAYYLVISKNQMRFIHWRAAKQVAKYIKKAPYVGLRPVKCASLAVSWYYDASHAADTLDRKSTTGIIFTFG